MTKPTTTKLGAKIRSARKAKGRTQEELAAKVGVTKATINKYESGIVTNFSRPRIKALADALDISPLEFIGFESPQSITFTPKNAHKLTDLLSSTPPVFEINPSKYQVVIDNQGNILSVSKSESEPKLKPEPELTPAPQPDDLAALYSRITAPAPAPQPGDMTVFYNHLSAPTPSPEVAELLRIFDALPAKQRWQILDLAFKLEKETDKEADAIKKESLE